MPNARKRAEEALATFDAFAARKWDDDNPEAPTLREAVLAMEAALRALLAEEPEAPKRCQCAAPDHCAAGDAPPEVRDAAASAGEKP